MVYLYSLSMNKVFKQKVALDNLSNDELYSTRFPRSWADSQKFLSIS